MLLYIYSFAMSNGYTNENNTKNLTGEGIKIVKNFENIVFIKEFTEADGYDRHGPKNEIYHLYVFVQGATGIEKHYFTRYVSNIRAEAEPAYDEMIYTEVEETRLEDKLADENEEGPDE